MNHSSSSSNMSHSTRRLDIRTSATMTFHDGYFL
ncbi:hypothetical protein AZE42_14013 [Rhizopogon vesiculosus]|uniref:Uncharacterized protein n=1 Tax=Rhizopogon vesiculosus TaxID=180088 RepID=A0A1J8QZ57_9AGAM|nr:hypothetical protein AZE42_14013 [Rhizopogon vesiculosus]